MEQAQRELSMPFKSRSQQRWAFSEAGRKALGGKEKVMEWAHATDFTDLPERVSAKAEAKREQRRRAAARALKGRL